jgi:DNA-binding transcriptional LysR family regulator
MDLIAAMRLFVRVVETGSFSAVAVETAQGQSAVSKQVAALEDHLGTRLLERSTRRHRLTEDGQVFYDHARDVLESAAAAEAAVGRRRQRPEGLLRVGTTTGFARAQIIPRLPRFMALYPELSVELVLSDSRADLIGQGLDLVIRIGQLADSGLILHRLGTSRRLLMASPAYLARRGVPQSPADLAGHDLLLYTPLAHGDVWELQSAAGLLTLPVRGRLRFNSSEGVWAAARAGLGIGRLTTWSVGDDLDAGRLVQVLPDYAPPDFTIAALWPSRRHTPAKVQALVAFLSGELAADPQMRSA